MVRAIVFPFSSRSRMALDDTIERGRFAVCRGDALTRHISARQWGCTKKRKGQIGEWRMENGVLFKFNMEAFEAKSRMCNALSAPTKTCTRQQTFNLKASLVKFLPHTFASIVKFLNWECHWNATKNVRVAKWLRDMTNNDGSRAEKKEKKYTLTRCIKAREGDADESDSAC